jgi:hypothetical protein
VKADRVDEGAGKLDEVLGGLIAELTEKVERDREFEPPVREPIHIPSIGEDPPPALRHLRETHDEFYARMRATLDSVRRRR